MTERRAIEQRIALCERLEGTVSYGLAFVVAAIYVVVRYRDRVIATYSWSIPALVVFGLCKFGFAWWRTKLEQALRGLDAPVEASLPTAVARTPVRVAPQPQPLPRIEIQPPAPVVPADPASGPRFLG